VKIAKIARFKKKNSALHVPVTDFALTDPRLSVSIPGKDFAFLRVSVPPR
jgi:hypothetical protein